MPDQFRQPLRRRGISDHLKALRPSALAAASLAVAAAAVGFGTWLVTASDGYYAGPMVRVSVAPAEPALPLAAEDRSDPAEALDEVASLPATLLPTPEDIAADEALAERAQPVVPRKRPLAPAPIAAVSEKGEFGPLPRIAGDGRTPFDVYAASVPASVVNSNRPKIAIVLGGMGLNPQLTRQAMRDLPSTVTFAFAPYGDAVQTLAAEARAQGHEIMLHLPMEPFGYPAVDPGPRTLRAGDGADANAENLAWLLSRFAGYSGIVNYMGARLGGDEAALRPVLAEVGKRGLVWLDDGSSSRSLVHGLAREIDLPVRRAQVIDDATYDDIRKRLAQLEEEAHRSGVAIGSGAGLAVTIDAVQTWARDLADRGVDLVPASAIFRQSETPRSAAADEQN
ncbi:MAG TPA: divergent polysaccharide deacetylase family protein [Aestuariivirgaceae bacterium]|nr:divergent polysaccharide deacetylase family protein [Aestuariivirgaceae bacterium]